MGNLRDSPCMKPSYLNVFSILKCVKVLRWPTMYSFYDSSETQDNVIMQFLTKLSQIFYYLYKVMDTIRKWNSEDKQFYV